MPASALMNVMITAARKAGRSLARDFGEVEQLQVSIKGPGNFVTAADHKAEDAAEGATRHRARPPAGHRPAKRGHDHEDEHEHLSRANDESAKPFHDALLLPSTTRLAGAS